MDRKYVVFEVDKEFFGIPIEQVERILAEMPITKIPRSPKIVAGIFELRGSTLPVVDLRVRFDRPATATSSNLIVIPVSGERVALRVDRVDGIIELAEAVIDRDLAMLRQKEDDFIAGVAKDRARLVLILEPEHLIPIRDRARTLKLAVA
ncbi:MAG: purine-binding chemotaxis protein CheW [Chthonomonas sp.]|nr:purine-binding chemotaxis protein CheW [Chthonomonas sp.]